MQFSVLSSGSKANATVVWTSKGAILIDCGLPLRTLEQRLAQVNVDTSWIRGILVTHEHSDHVRGLCRVSRRYKIPVFMNDATYEAYRSMPGDNRVYQRESLPRDGVGELAGIEFRAFSVSHDAADPVAFRLTHQGLRFVQCTDLGRVTRIVEEMVTEVHALVLESNHDEELLRQCEYPWVLKQRILSNQGHLSNHTAGGLLSTRVHEGLGVVVLGHLSEHSNTPEVALQTVRRYLEREPGTLCCASIYGPTEVFRVGAYGLNASPANARSAARTTGATTGVQMTVPLGAAPLGTVPSGSAPLGTAPLGTVPLGTVPT